jgi:hypothetical protein
MGRACTCTRSRLMQSGQAVPMDGQQQRWNNQPSFTRTNTQTHAVRCLLTATAAAFVCICVRRIFRQASPFLCFSRHCFSRLVLHLLPHLIPCSSRSLSFSHSCNKDTEPSDQPPERRTVATAPVVVCPVHTQHHTGHPFAVFSLSTSSSSSLHRVHRHIVRSNSRTQQQIAIAYQLVPLVDTLLT